MDIRLRVSRRHLDYLESLGDNQDPDRQKQLAVVPANDAGRVEMRNLCISAEAPALLHLTSDSGEEAQFLVASSGSIYRCHQEDTGLFDAVFNRLLEHDRMCSKKLAASFETSSAVDEVDVF